MMSFRLSFRIRFMLATLAVALIPLTGFIYAIVEFLYSYEAQVMHGELEREMSMFELAYRGDPNMAPPDMPLLTGLIVKPSNEQTLPAPLVNIAPGKNREIEIENREYNVSRRDVDGASLYLLLDIALIEEFEDDVEALAWACGVSALLFALLVAFFLANIVNRPVKKLARVISGIEPGSHRPELMLETGDREIGRIAQAFDNVLDRFDAFAMREKHFTEDASHELRTPLAIVTSSAELIANDTALSEKSRTRLTRLRMAATQMHELIEALLFLGREDGGGTEKSCSVADVIEQAVTSYNIVISKETALLHLDIQGDYNAHAPRGMVLIVVNNLLRNAVEHGEYGPVDVSLTNKSLVVQNGGHGIDPTELPKSFDHRQKRIESHGQGLGLSIVKRICDRLGWRIEVDTAPDTGATFKLCFPVT